MIFVGDDWAEDHHDVYLMDEAGQAVGGAAITRGPGRHPAAARADRRARRGTRPGGDRHRNRSWPVGRGAGRGRLSGVRDQPDGGGPLPRPPPRLGREIRCLRRQAAGRSGPHRPAQPSPDRRRQPRRRGDQGAGPRPSEPDLGAHPAHQHAAQRRCASTTRPPWRPSIDLADGDALAVLGRAPTPEQGARLSLAKIRSALKRGWPATQHRRTRHARSRPRCAPSSSPHPPRSRRRSGPPPRAAVGIIAELNRQIAELEAALADHFETHPDADIYRSLPGLGVVLGARVLGEFGDDPNRYTDAKSRKNYAGTSPLTVASGTKRAVLARHVRNRRLYDALDQWAFCALTDQPRRPRLLRPAPRRRRHPPPSPTRPRQPTRRHPPRLPTPPHPLQRTHRLGTPPHQPAA